MIELAVARRLLPLGALVAGAAALLIVHSCSIDRAETRGAVRQDDKWQAGQDKADADATTTKRVTEAASKAASLRTGETYDSDLQDLRRRYAALRDRVQRQGGNGASGGADRGQAGAAGAQADAEASGDANLRQAEIERLRQHLIEVAQEGDEYRLQVIGLQDWIAGQQEATALGQAAATEKDAADARH